MAVTTPEGANLAQRLNVAVADSSGWSIIFLDDCVDVNQPDWLLELLGPLQLDKVAMVGPQLMDPAYQHGAACRYRIQSRRRPFVYLLG